MSNFTIVIPRESNEITSIKDLLKNSDILLHNNNTNNQIELSTDSFFISANITNENNGKIYIDHEEKSDFKSFCIYFGWCYEIDSNNNSIGSKEMKKIIIHQRQYNIPYDQYLSGNYAMISYDNIKKTLWITTDLWATHGYYYGFNNDYFVVSSKSSIVANLLESSIDGISYVSLLRGTVIPPGRTLYSKVHRITPGRAIYIDLSRKSAKLIQTQKLFRPIKQCNFNDSLNQFCDSIINVSKRLTSSPSTAIDLTGGNDSRLTAAALSILDSQYIAEDIVFKVVGNQSDPDVIIAKKIADLLNWNIIVDDREIEIDTSIKFLSDVILLSDGIFLPLPNGILRNIFREKYRWACYNNLVGSIGGELFRDFYWKHEKLNIRNRKHINYELLLKYRMYADENIEIDRITQGRINIENHNEKIIHPYKLIEKKFQKINKFYLLNIIFLHKYLYNNSIIWVFSPFRKTMLPYLTSEVTSVSLSINWKFKVGRRLVTAAVERINPDLSKIPTDSKAPMVPKRISTLNKYLYYNIYDIYNQINKRFIKKTQKPESLVLPKSWIEYLSDDEEIKTYYDTCNLLELAYKHPITRNDYHRELTGLLMIKVLFDNYSGIKKDFKYDIDGPDLIEENILLF